MGFTLDSLMTKYLMRYTIYVTLVRMAKIFVIGTHHPQARIELLLVKMMNTQKHFQSLEDQGYCILRRNFLLLCVD